MLPASDGDTTEGRTPAVNATLRSVFVIGPDKKVKLTLTHPMTTGPNFDEVLRAIDSIQLTQKHDLMGLIRCCLIYARPDNRADCDTKSHVRRANRPARASSGSF